jgi:hypothetical protein
MKLFKLVLHYSHAIHYFSPKTLILAIIFLHFEMDCGTIDGQDLIEFWSSLARIGYNFVVFRTMC